MELWAGFECTRNRVGDCYHDQLDQSTRSARTECLERLSDLGIKAFRYRVAWDDPLDPIDNAKADLSILATQNIKPIIGLIHHGSGPSHTDLLSDNFATGLAAHASAVASNFPWVDHWTPVNEPLTTARFSALYGHWYPHERNEGAFWLALLNQTDATRLAMREIRKLNPQAKLVQTEDLGKTFATAALADQAAFDNQRRWMTWDLLTGKVTIGHPFYERLNRLGFAERLHVIADNPCPPDIIGVDHYLTSDRFLDHRISLYPPHHHGGNHSKGFADLEAARVLSTPPDGIETALAEAWDRYHIPVALTECHNGCTREEQMRWLREGWQAGLKLNQQGRNIVAVASWALMGARDWSSLVTENRGDFESGAFDPRGGNARPTGVATMIKAIAQKTEAPVAALGDGWWRRESRLHYPALAFARRSGVSPVYVQAPPLLIAGATGTLGQAIMRAARARRIRAIMTSRHEMAVDCETSVENAIHRYRPWAVINATGWVRVDDAEGDADACNRANVTAPLTLARHCDRLGIPNVHFSSDLVFGGEENDFFHETDLPNPLNVYGESKAQADALLTKVPTSLIIRTAAFFSPHDGYNFAVAATHALREGRKFAASADHRVTPTYVPHLADLVLDLLIDGETGLWHASNGEALSWFEFARRVVDACKLDAKDVETANVEQLGWVAKRPLRSGLASLQGQQLPSLTTAIQQFATVLA